jgi:copper(I)-binding protein
LTRLGPRRATLEGVRHQFAMLAAGCAGVAAVVALTAASPGSHESPAPSGGVSAAEGQLRIAGDTGTGYLELHNASTRQVVVQAAVSPAAASVLWTTRQQVVTSADLFTASALCEDEPSMEAEADAAALALHELVINPGQTLALQPGSGALQLTELTPGIRQGAHVPVTLYLDNGQQLTTDLTVT